MIAENQDALFREESKEKSALRFLNPGAVLGRVSKSFSYLRTLAVGAKRRQGWFMENLTFRRAFNMGMTAVQFALKGERMYTLPVAVKIDISPMCNLSCTVCVHADPNGNAALEKQVFDPKHRMSVEQFRRIVNEVRGVSSAVSLYYVGDPLVHPDLDEMCRVAQDAGLNVHISSNFSFALTDARIRRIVRSGLTHLSVCVDGLSQEKYEMTRVGGRIDRVLSNLRRLCQYRDELGQEFPKVEVQYIKFQHNVDELDEAKRVVEAFGVDQFTHFWGALNNYTDDDPDAFEIIAPKENKQFPQCWWPHSSIVIKYNGDVIPCCTYRIGQQYSETDDPRILGNVFKTSLREVWNSEQYRRARRMVSNPRSVERDPALKDHFCHGCPALFQTTDNKNHRNAKSYRHEDLYDMGPDGRPIRKPAPATGLPDRGELVSRVGLPGGAMARV